MSTAIYKKLLEIKKKVPYLQKDKKGFNYTYVTPTAVCATINPIMNELGLLLITNVIDSKSYEIPVPTKNDPHKKEWKFDLDFIFTWVDVETGERVDIPWKASGCNGEDKGLGSALTYAERYFLLKQFNIPTDNDDPDNFQDKFTSEEEKTAKKQTKQQQRVGEAIAEMYLATTLDELKATWTKHKAVQTDPGFVAAKEEMKVKIKA
jgi:hypothetical protein